MTLAKLSTRGRVTIPKEIREKLQLKQGDRVAFVRVGDVIYMQPVKNSMLDMEGSIAVSREHDFDEVRKETIRRMVDLPNDKSD